MNTYSRTESLLRIARERAAYAEYEASYDPSTARRFQKWRAILGLLEQHGQGSPMDLRRLSRIVTSGN